MQRIERTRWLVGSVLTLVLTFPMWVGAQTKPPADWSTRELKEAVANATTAQDHHRIAEYYAAAAARLDAEAKDHADLAELYRKAPNLHEQKHPMSPQTAAHCQWLASRDKEMAQRNRDLAKLHENMAKSLSQ